MYKTWRSLQETGKHDSGSHDSRSDLHNSPTTLTTTLLMLLCMEIWNVKTVIKCLTISKMAHNRSAYMYYILCKESHNSRDKSNVHNNHFPKWGENSQGSFDNQNQIYKDLKGSHEIVSWWSEICAAKKANNPIDYWKPHKVTICNRGKRATFHICHHNLSAYKGKLRDFIALWGGGMVGG